MNSIVTTSLLVPLCLGTSTELYARRLKYLDPDGTRLQSIDAENLIDIYNRRVAVPGSVYTGDDMYESILYTILCGVSTDSVSYDQHNRCKKLVGASRDLARSVLGELRELIIGPTSGAPPKPFVRIASGPPPIARVESSTRGAKERADWILEMRKRNASGSGIESPVDFDQIAKTWELLLRTNGASLVVDNKVIVHGLHVMLETGVNALIPKDPTIRSEIIAQFCIIFRAFFKSEKKRNLVSECGATNAPSLIQLNEARSRLKKLLTNINLGIKT